MGQERQDAAGPHRDGRSDRRHAAGGRGRDHRRLDQVARERGDERAGAADGERRRVDARRRRTIHRSRHPAPRAEKGRVDAGAARLPDGQAEARRLDQQERSARPSRRLQSSDRRGVARIRPRTRRTTPASTSTRTGCARNAASSASSIIPTPPRLSRSGCTRCSIAARRRRASSLSTASGSTPSAARGWSATTSPTPRPSTALPGRAGDRPCALFDHRRDHAAQRPAAVRRTRGRRPRGRP